MLKRQRDRALLDVAALTAAWAAAVALAWPRGNFPLNDDWDFALATWSFARTGSFHFTNFTATSLRAQVLWGAAWTRMFGESFEVLRLSTLVLGALTIAIVHYALRLCGASRPVRFIGTLAFAFNPLFFWSSCTFMTEVPYVCASAIAFVLLFRALDEDRLDLLVAGSAAVIVSWFIRQTGVAALAAPLALVLGKRSSLTPRWKTFAAVLGSILLLFVAILVIRPEWLAGSTAEFSDHMKVWKEPTFGIPEQLEMIRNYAVFNAQNSALFFLPLTLPLFLLAFRRETRWEVALVAGIAAIIGVRIFELVVAGHSMPYFPGRIPCCDITAGNVLVDWGLGPQTISDVWRRMHRYPLALTEAGRFVLTWGSGLLAVALVWRSVITLVRDRRTFVQLAILAAIAGTLPLFGSRFYFDRYSLDSAWSIGLAAVLMVDWSRRSTRMVAAICLAAIVVFDVAAVQEYFAWNRARWAALEALRTQGIAIESIDAGAEPFSFYEISRMSPEQRRRNVIGFRPRPYLLAMEPTEGYRVIADHSFFGWLGWHRGTVLTLQRQ